ncbi:hypothetical protein [Peribacillus kribbensis]|nr:hypothetical protein [Peribacillus kribbensis]
MNELIKGILEELLTAIEILLILSSPFLIYFAFNRKELKKKK